MPNKLSMSSMRTFLCLGVLTVLCVGMIWAQTPDPLKMGPYKVTRDDYGLRSDSDFDTIEIDRYSSGDVPTGETVTSEFVGSVHAPSDLSDGPFPIIFFLHGRFVTCRGLFGYTASWPCPARYRPIWSYRGYDYISDVLASWGYIVVSISANAINSTDPRMPDFGRNERADLVLAHIDRWNEWGTGGGEPFGDRFVKAIDFDRIGLMGHSRGGEGVVTAYRHNLARESNRYNIRAVYTLAPVDSTINTHRYTVAQAHLGALLPYCDGDVFDLSGIRYFDRSRYVTNDDPWTKQYVLIMGTNHDWYNTLWDFNDDWTAFRDRERTDPFCVPPRAAGGGRLTHSEQRTTATVYISGFLRLYVGNEVQFQTLYTGDDAPPDSVADFELYTAYMGPTSDRLTVDRVPGSSSLRTNTLGGEVTAENLNPFTTCFYTGCNPTPPRVPSGVYHQAYLLKFGWDAAGAWYMSQIPADYQDVSSYGYLSFRVSQNHADERNPSGQAQDFTITLTDRSGASASAPASSGQAIYSPPGGRLAVKSVLITLRIPLTSFKGIDLTQIQSIRLDFDPVESGALFATDLQFTN